MTKQDHQAHRPLRFLLIYIQRHLGLFLAAVILTVLYAGADLLSTWTMGQILDHSFDSMGHISDQRMFFSRLGLMAILILLAPLGRYYSSRASQRLATRATKNMQEDLWRHLQRLPLSFFDQWASGQIVSRLTSDMRDIRVFYESCASSFLPTLVYIVLSYTLLWISNPSLTLLTIVPLLLYIGSMQLFRSLTERYSLRYRKARGKVTAKLTELLSNQDVIRAFGRQESMVSDFSQHTEEEYQAEKRIERVDAFMSWNLFNFIQNATLAMILGYFAYRYFSSNNAFPLGTAFIFLTALRQVFMRLNMLGSQMSQLGKAYSAITHVQEFMAMEPEADAVYPPVLPELYPHAPHSKKKESPFLCHSPSWISFQKVNFSYLPDVPVLKDVSLEVAQGQTVALAGSTGSGKTTVMSLVQRLYEIDEGQIYFDGQPLPSYDRRDLRRRMAVVQQDPFLFQGSLYENIACGREGITEEMAANALLEVGGEALLRRSEKGMESLITENGKQFSSGEKQLISFARALVQNPELLLLDEATSHVDSETEALIQQGLHRLKQGRTVLMVAHRLSTIRHADRIYLFDHGRIVEEGTHESLIEAGGLYASYVTASQNGFL